MKEGGGMGGGACSKNGGGVCKFLWSNVKAKIPKRSGLQPKSFAISYAVLC